MNYSPQIAILEAITCSLTLLFYFWHSWHYDRLQPMFKRKRVKTSGRNYDSKNSFHLIMRFIYLICLPIYTVQGGMVAYMKYQVGYLPAEMGGYPVPYTSWPQNSRNLIYVIYYLKALGWSGEGIVHLEELAFWIFLIRLKDKSPPWFKSRFFQAFALSSLLSSTALLCIVGGLKPNVLLTQAVMTAFATGYNLVITCAFFWVLFKFPAWLRDLETCGAPTELIIRLHGFGNLNQIRTVFRLIFLAPLFALSMDGLMPRPFLNKYVWAVDLISMSSAVAFAAQAVITLLIFLPRDLRSECGFTREEIKNRFENIDRPISSQSLQDLCLLDSHPSPSQQPLCTFPFPSNTSPRSTSTSLIETRRNYITTPTNQPAEETTPHPFSFSEYETSGSRFTRSQLDKVAQFANSRRQSSFTCEREFDEPSFHPCDSIKYLSARTRSGATEISESNFEKLLQTRSTQTNFSSQFPKESAPLAQSHPVSFPISSPVTHFPRYFAPSEHRAQVSDVADGVISLCTLSRSASLQQNPTLPNINAPRESGEGCSIHPAIRNFKSPIDIYNTSDLEGGGNIRKSDFICESREMCKTSN